MRCFLIACSALLLGACANFNATLDTARAIWRSPPPQLVQGFEYLEVRVGSHRTVMALGQRRQADGAWMEQWFSGQGEMLELRDGRIHRVLGMTHEVRQTEGAAPAWPASPGSAGSRWQRQRQVMPGYQLREERIDVTPMAAPASGALSDALWVQHTVSTHRLGGQPWQYQERFALRQGQVVYSEQCVSPELCFQLRPLGVAP